MQLVPFITFNGTCEEAMNFYAQCLGGTITTMSRYEGTPMEVPDDYKQKIMHSELVFENNHIMACDASPDQAVTHGSDFSLTINVAEVFIMDDVFKKLSAGGNVTMPLQDTFWGARFGMFIDKFGIRWMFNCDLN